MTITQRNALEKIRVVRDMQVRRLAEVIATDPQTFGGCHPSEWVSVATLTSDHRIRYATIKALAKRGRLLMRPTDGWGPEAKVVED